MCLKNVAGRSDLQLFALPMKYINSDGAPVRAVAEIRDFSEKENG
jgi:kynurenine formamidase